jgi:branched-chain amino acid transport system substrate-binding protein
MDAVKRVVAEHKPVNRSTVREAIQNSQVPTLQGVVAFDQNGDLKDHKQRVPD